MFKKVKIHKRKPRIRIKKENLMILEDESEEEIPMSKPFFSQMVDLQDQKELESRGIILINEAISKESLARATNLMLCLHYDKDFVDDIQIILNSPGGYCDAGWAFIDLMDFVKNKVVTICMGEICSMATSIFINGEERIMAPNSLAMIHQFSNESSGSYSDLVANRKMEDLVMNMDIRHLIKCSKYGNEAQIRKHILKDSDHWLSPRDMKKHGLCDKVSRPKRYNRNKK